MTVGICALGTATPQRVVSNDELAAYLDTSDEWVRTRTGIGERRVADPDTATSDLAVAAGREALVGDRGNGAVDAVIVATATPDHLVPPTAPLVAARLGLRGVTAFDVNAACSGFVTGLAVAAGLVSSGAATRVLMIGAETLSRITDWEDRDTAVLFADGAGAVVLEPCAAGAPGALSAFDLGADGGLAELLIVPAGGSRRPASAETVSERGHYLRMAGREVYRHAVAGMAASSLRTLDRAGLEPADVQHLIGHQANARILSAVADRLGVPEHRRVVNVDRYGNTSSASIPLAMADLAAAGARPGDRVLLTAFGAGLTWASALLHWPQLADRHDPEPEGASAAPVSPPVTTHDHAVPGLTSDLTTDQAIPERSTT